MLILFAHLEMLKISWEENIKKNVKEEAFGKNIKSYLSGLERPRNLLNKRYFE